MDHELNTLLGVSMENLKDMIDVNTVIGKPIFISEDVKVIPISKVRLGFLAGGSEFNGKKEDNPFGGGTGGTIFITPVAFLVCNGSRVEILHLEAETHLTEKVIDSIPNITNRIQTLFKDMTDVKKL